jgi:hypothetical protein
MDRLRTLIVPIVFVLLVAQLATSVSVNIQ